MDIPATLDTAKFRQLVLQGIESLSGGGGASSTNTAVGPDGVTRVPLNVNADGELKVNVEASIDADLTLIEGKLDTIIGIETPQAADIAAIKTKLNNSIAVTGTFYQATQPVSIATMPTTPVTGTFFQATQPVSGTVTANTGLSQPLTDTQLRATAVPVSGTFYQDTQPVSGTISSNTKDGSGTSITSTAVSSKQGLDVNIIAGGGSSVVTNAGTFAVQNTAATPAGTNFIGSVNPDSTGSGSVTTSVPFVVTVTNSGTLAFQSDAAATGNVTIEASVDGTNYTATTYTALTTGNTSSSFNAATATIGQIDTSGFKNIRFRSNTIVGTVGITYNLSKNVSNVMLDNPLPTGSNLIGKINPTDGNGNLITIKAASTASSATDTSTVVALSPNSPLPVGSNAIGSVSVSNFPSSTEISNDIGNPIPVSGTVAVSGTIPVSAASALPVSGAVTSNPPAGSLTMSNSSVGTSSATLLAAASATKALAIQNTSANILYVSTTSPATATNSIVLSAGQGYEFSYVPSTALYALGSAASTTYTLWYA